VHFLTKLLVVFAAVLSLLLSGLVIMHSLNVSRIEQDYKYEVSRRQASDAALAAQNAQTASEGSRRAEEVSNLNSQIASLTSEKNRLEQLNTQLTSDKTQAVLSRDSVLAQIGQLGETVKTQQKLIDSYRDEVTGLRKNELRYKEQSLQTDERLSDLQSQNEVLTQNIRALREQLEEAKQAAQSAMAGGTGIVSRLTGKSADPFLYTGPRLDGKVESIRPDDATGAQLVQINLGSTDGIRENMKLFAVRNNEFVANLIVVQTDLKVAFAKVDTLGRTVQVQAGDVATTQLKQ